MQPALFNKNIICYKPFNPDELRQGQIIIYKDDSNQSISHRIKALLNDGVIVQGDNNKPHEEVSYSRIEGIVALIILA